MRGLYPENAKQTANEIEELEEGDIIDIEPEIGNYEERWQVIDPDNIVHIKDGLALLNISQKIKATPLKPWQRPNIPGKPHWVHI